MTEPKYYDINVQIYSDNGVIYYSVVQEHEDAGAEKPEPLVYGTADSFEEALVIAKDAVTEALK